MKKKSSTSSRSRASPTTPTDTSKASMGSHLRSLLESKPKSESTGAREKESPKTCRPRYICNKCGYDGPDQVHMTPYGFCAYDAIPIKVDPLKELEKAIEKNPEDFK